MSDDRPKTFTTQIEWNGDKTGRLTLENGIDLTVSPPAPPRSGGVEGTNCPQELFVASATACLMTTFLYMVGKTHAEATSFSCRAEGTVEMVEDRGPVFTRIDLYPKATAPDEKNAKRLTRALDLAKKNCTVTNSMSCETVMHSEVTVG